MRHDLIGNPMQGGFHHPQNPKLSEEREALSPSPIAVTMPSNEILQRIISSPASDALFPIHHPLSYADMHTRLRKYLDDKYRFRTVADVLAFVKLLGNVNGTYGGWVI